MYENDNDAFALNLPTTTLSSSFANHHDQMQQQQQLQQFQVTNNNNNNNNNIRFIPTSSLSPPLMSPSSVVFDASSASSSSSMMMSEQFILALYRCPFQNVFNYTTRDLDLLLTYKHYISGWLCLLVILVGLIANSITICALLHRYMRKSSTNAYLLALAFSNLCSLFCLLLMIGARFTLVHPYRVVYCKSWYENFINQAMPWLTPINNLFQLSGIYLIVAVSIDRLVIVRKQVKPTIGNRRRRKIFTWLVIFTIYLFSFVFTLPNWFLYETTVNQINITYGDILFNSRDNGDRSYDFDSSSGSGGGGGGIQARSAPHSQVPHQHDHNHNYNNNDNSRLLYKLIHYKTSYTKFGASEKVKQLTSIYLYIPFVFGLPILVLVGVNALIIYELFKISARKRQLGTAARLDRNITLMLVAIVLVFLVCQVPLTVSHILLAYQPDLIFARSFFVYNSFTSFLTCVNLSANFCLFLFFGQAFRDTLQFMFCLRDTLPDHSHHSKRAPSLFFNTTTAEFSRRGSSLIQSFYNTFANGSRKGSASSGAELRLDVNGGLNSRFFQHRKSLPAVLMEKIVEKEDTGGDFDPHDANRDMDAQDEENERTSFGVAMPRSTKPTSDMVSNHVRFMESVVSKSSSSVKSNRVRRFSEQYRLASEYSLK